VVFNEEEKAALLPWDGEPYEVADWRDVTVHPNHHIASVWASGIRRPGSMPPAAKRWLSTSSMCAVWNGSSSKHWKPRAALRKMQW
jgi:hypothetical protein